MITVRRGARVATILLSVAFLAGCSTMGGDPGIAANDQPAQLAPVQDSTVSSGALPPIAGASSTNQTQLASAAPAPTGGDGGDPGLAGTPPAAGGTAGSGTFVSLNDVGKTSTTGGRNLSGSLTIEKLLGGWTVTSGATTCRLNLTYTAKTDTNRYRASAPGCQMPTLAAVSSWQLAGTQVQLFNDSDKMVGALLLSGNRFIGTLTGGQAISMVG